MKGITEERLRDIGEGYMSNNELNCLVEEECTELSPQWEPIESAPKDRDILLTFDTSEMMVATLNEISWIFYKQFTHWQELPLPPCRTKQELPKDPKE